MKQDEIPQNNVDKSEKLFCVTDYNTHIVQNSTSKANRYNCIL